MRQAMTPGLRMTSEGFSFKGPKNGVHDLVDHITPDAELFIVTHMGLLEIDQATWSLTIDGLVRNQMRLSLPDILDMPQSEIMSFHECAGSPLTPREPKRRIGNVVWKGVRLREILELSGVDTQASFVWTYGLEWGKFANVENEPYAKDLPLTKALSDEVLLATEMNGEPLRRHDTKVVNLSEI